MTTFEHKHGQLNPNCRYLVAIVLLVLTNFCFTTSAEASGAIPNDSLYGLTYDGKLLRIDKATGAGTLVRQLPAKYSGSATHPSGYKVYWGFDSLIYVPSSVNSVSGYNSLPGGFFYATHNGNLNENPNPKAQLLRFGFEQGDEVELGVLSVQSRGDPRAVDALEMSGSGMLPTVLATSDIPGTSILNSVVGMGKANLFGPVVATTRSGYEIDTREFANATDLAAFVPDPFDVLDVNQPGYLAANVNAFAHIPQSGLQNPVFPTNCLGPINDTSDLRYIQGMAIEPVTNKIFAASGAGIDNSTTPQTNHAPKPSRLYVIYENGVSNFCTNGLWPDPADDAPYVVGDVGFSGVRGLTFGPVDSCSEASVPNTLQVNNQTISTTVEYKAGMTLISSNVVVQNTGNVTYRSGNSISINPGFSVKPGGVFRAVIDSEVCA